MRMLGYPLSEHWLNCVHEPERGEGGAPRVHDLQSRPVDSEDYPQRAQGILRLMVLAPQLQRRPSASPLRGNTYTYDPHSPFSHRRVSRSS